LNASDATALVDPDRGGLWPCRSVIQHRRRATHTRRPAPRVVPEYPDSGKLWGLGFAPGGEHATDTPEIIGRPEDNLDYFEGES